MSARHGAMMFHADVPSTHCAQRASSGNDGVASVSGGAAAVRFTTTARIGMRSSFGCSGSEAAPMSCTTSCRIQLMTSSNSRRFSQEALRSRQSDVVVEEEAEEELASFWDRLQRAWRVLIGASTEAQATKNRFSRLLVRDRGFNSTNLSRLYNVAKGAIKQHVELEGDEDTKVTAVVDRLGELRLDFRVKRVKSVLIDEPFAHPVVPDIEPSLSIDGHRWWEDSTALQDSDTLVGGALDEHFSHSVLPNMEPSMLINRDQLWEGRRDPHHSGVRVGALDERFPNSVLPDVEPSLSVSGDRLWEDTTASRDFEVHVGGASNLKSSMVGGASDDPFPTPVLPAVEPSLSITGDQSLEDSRSSEALPHHVGRAFNLESSTVGASDEPFANSALSDVEPRLSNSGDQSEDTRTAHGLRVFVRGASNLKSTDVDAEGVWYTFSFTDGEVEQGTEGAQVDGDLD